MHENEIVIEMFDDNGFGLKQYYYKPVNSNQIE